MNTKEPLQILRGLGISYCDSAESTVASVITEVTKELQKKDNENLFQVADLFLPFASRDLFSPIWIKLLELLTAHSEGTKGAKILADMTKKEMENYKAGKGWLPLPVLELLLSVYLPSLEHRVLIMVDKILTEDSADQKEKIIKGSHLVLLSQREAHVFHCVCSMLDTLESHSSQIRDVKNSFTSLVNAIPNTCLASFVEG